MKKLTLLSMSLLACIGATPSFAQNTGLVCAQNAQGVFGCRTGQRPAYTPPPPSGIGAIIGTTPGTTVGTTTPPVTPFVTPPYVQGNGGNPPGVLPGNLPPNNGGGVILGTPILGSAPEIGTSSMVANTSTRNRTPFIGGVTGEGYYRYFAAKSVSPSYCSRETPAVSSYWIRGVDYQTRFGEAVGAVDWIALLPNEIASYEFTVPITATYGGGGPGLNDATYSVHVGFNISISKTPCHFNPTDGLWTYNNKTRNICADNSGSSFPNIPYVTSQPGEPTTPGANVALIGSNGFPLCALEMGKTYYVNIRIPPANGTNPVIDRCEQARRGYASGAMGAANVGVANTLTCGGIIKF